MNRSAFQISHKWKWCLWIETFKFLPVSPVIKVCWYGNGCNLCNGWNVNLTLLLICTFEHKGNKTGASGWSSTMINYNSAHRTHHKTRVANLLTFFNAVLNAEFYVRHRDRKMYLILLCFASCDTVMSRIFSSRLSIKLIRQNQKFYINNSGGI